MPLCRYVVVALWLYLVMSECCFVVMPLHRDVVMSFCLCASRVLLSLSRSAVMLLCRFVFTMSLRRSAVVSSLLYVAIRI